MSRKFSKRPVLGETYQIPRYKYTEEDEKRLDAPREYGEPLSQWQPVYRTKTNTIEVPDNINKLHSRKIHLVIRDTEGNEILKQGYYAENVVDDISRYLPHWGFKVVSYTASDPNVWIVEKETDDYMTVTTIPYPKKGLNANTITDIGTMSVQELYKTEQRRDELWDKEDHGTLTPEEREELETLQKNISDHYDTKRRVHADSDMFGMDDAFFTKEDLIEFSTAVEDDVNARFTSFNSPFNIQCNGIWLEDDNRTITMDYICFPNETQYSTSIKIDFRQIKAPGDIFKYVEKMCDKVNQTIQDAEVVGSCSVQASEYIPDLTERYPEGFRDLDPYVEDEEFEPDQSKDYVGNVLPFGDEDGYYCVTAYYDSSYRGRADDFSSNSFDDIILKCNEYCNNGFYIEVENAGSGEGKRYSPDEWLESIDQTGEPPYSVYNLSDGNIESSTNINCSDSSDDITFEQAAQIVADYFNQQMEEGEFDSFEEMRDCYWWTINDIKDEVDYVLRDATNGDAYIDELDRSDVFIGSKDMPYRKFSTMWRKLLKKSDVEGESGTVDEHEEREFTCSNGTDVMCSTSIDDLENIAHDVFNDVMSKGKRDNISDDVIFQSVSASNPELSEEDKQKVVELVNENIESYYDFGSFGRVQAEKYGDKILEAYEGQTISKRLDEADGPGGIRKCAKDIGLGTYQMLEALEGMCADGRARELTDSTYYIGK